MRIKHELPEWCREAKKALIDRGMTVTDLAKEIGKSRTHVSYIINGYVQAEPTERAIREYLGISA